MVSVIVPNYNHAAYLQQRIDSILAQTYTDFELIILDDYSTDDSRQVIEQYRHHPKTAHIVYNKVNSGSAFVQWQKGVALARGELIWMAESDDIASPGFLAVMVEKFIADEHTILACCQSVIIDDRGTVMHPVTDWFSRIDTGRWLHDFDNTGADECANYLVTQNTIPNASAVVFKKSIFNQVFAVLNLKLAGDWLLWVRMLLQGNMSYSALPLNYFRWHGGNVRSGFSHQIDELKECLEVIGYIRENVKVNPQALQTGYEVCVDRVLARLLKKSTLSEQQLTEELSAALEGITPSPQLHKAINTFITNNYYKGNKVSKVFSKLKQIFAGNK